MLLLLYLSWTVLVWSQVFIETWKTCLSNCINKHGQVNKILPQLHGPTSCEELTHWKTPSCWEGLGAGGEGDNREWDGWMASLTPCTWVWVNSGSWWWTGRPGVLRFMGLQRVRHDWATEVNWTDGWIYKKNQVYNCYFRLKLINSVFFHLCILQIGHISCGS